MTIFDAVYEEVKKRYREDVLVCHCCGKIIVDYRCLFSLLLLQNFYQKPFIITCYYRCPDWNKQVGGAISSRHLSGKAVDIITPTEDIDSFINNALACGFTTILYYPNRKFFHLDIQQRGYFISKNFEMKKKNGKSGLF